MKEGEKPDAAMIPPAVELVGNPYELLRDREAFCRSLSPSFNFEKESGYCRGREEVAAWWDDLHKSDAEEERGLAKEKPDFLFAHAKEAYAEARENLTRIDQRRENSINFAAGALAFLGTIAGFFKTPTPVLVAFAMCFFLLGIGVLIYSRRSIVMPAHVHILETGRALPDVPDPQLWMACSLYKAVCGLDILGQVMAAHLNAAIYSFLVGLSFLILSVAWSAISPREPPADPPSVSSTLSVQIAPSDRPAAAVSSSPSLSPSVEWIGGVGVTALRHGR